MSNTQHIPKVGAPEPELKNSPVFDNADYDFLSLDLVGHAENSFTSFIPSPHLPFLQDACCRSATATVLRRGRRAE
jgi:hypothetical protein